MFSVAQLILYATYYKSTKQQIAARNEKGKTNLSEVQVVASNGTLQHPNNNNNKIVATPNGTIWA